MQIILKEKQDESSHIIKLSDSACVHSVTRMKAWAEVVVWNAIWWYSRSEVDDLIEEVESKRVTFVAIDDQTSFDIWQQVSYIENATRNGIDLDPAIFTISSPYVQYNANLNGSSSIEQWDIIIINYR